ncbi:unnamed protein product [Adineta steineri]|uniref:Poly [ADP-ribose] polymerase n=1 Tax=Adineta steineri TaxID=433720 RepID=A0A814SJU2_9BILA|nr:unnamed protein product [Adineta steineri]CAF3780312.1 unnamed protein product [Adineta steineri]
MSQNSDEKYLKQCLKIIINAVSVQTTLSDYNLNNTIQQILDENLSSLSFQCRNYLLNVLNEFNSNDPNITLINDFLHNLNGRLSLLDASQGAWDGNISIVKNFIEKYPTLRDKSGLYGTTLLYSAARNNHFHLVKYLIEKGRCSVNAKNEEYLEKNQQPILKATIGSTALHAACFNGRLEIVKYLIQHGGDYFILNSVYESPIENGQSQSSIRNFFSEFLIIDYTKQSNIIPTRTILYEIEKTKEPINDCIWEFKPLSSDQWFPCPQNQSIQLQQTFLDKPFKTDIQLKTSRDTYHISLIKFLRSSKSSNQIENLSWIRCRGSSLRNFYCYSQWQIMFVQCPTGVTNSSSLLQIYDMKSKSSVQLNSWYNFYDEMNFLFETAMNYRRRYININLNFIYNEKVIFDLDNFSFMNEQKTIEGFLRWIPKIIPDNGTSLRTLDNFELPTNCEVALLTTTYLKQIELHANDLTDEINQYNLKYENAFDNDTLDFQDKKPVTTAKDVNESLNVIQNNLLEIESDVIVICTSSKYLFDSVFRAGGKSLQKSWDKKLKENNKAPVISISTDGKLTSKAVYFVPWEPRSDPDLLCRSIEKLVSNVINTAINENYKSIAFPAIGCGEYGCSVSLIAQAFISEVQRQLVKYPLKILFVIQPNKMDIYNEFRKQIEPFKQQERTSITVGKGIIQAEKGDITSQKVDVIIGSLSSENLRQSLLIAGGREVQAAYEKEYENNPNSLIISIPPGELPCKRLFFLRWEPDEDPDILRQSISDLIWNLIQNVNSHNFNSIAFPAIGCGEHACSVDIVVKTMVKEMKQQIMQRKLAWTVKFIIQPNQQNIYDEFRRQLLLLSPPDENNQEPRDYEFPSAWQNSKQNQIKLLVPKNTEEFKSIAINFDTAMKGNYTEIVKIERIQNERWYMQYLAHCKDFKKRLSQDTENRLYHGCPQVAANSIMDDCFNRSFAGVNGIAYGMGVYFSSNAVYSHGFTRPNADGERCMFIARVLVGKTTIGKSSMKTRPVGFDSTTDGKHIFVTYHDAQAYAEYLITYK